MFLGALLKEGSHFQLLLKKYLLCLKISQNDMYFWLKTLKLDNIPSHRFRQNPWETSDGVHL